MSQYFTIAPTWRSDATNAAPRVVVSGAGAAALACADTLRAAGARVTVLERRARLGGPIETERDGTRDPIEHGGAFIGSNHTTWVRLASELPLSF